MADPRSLDEVRAVLATHRADITRRFSAVGTGIGRPDPDGPYVITVYIADLPSAPPAVIDGVPLNFQVTGPFRAEDT
jgi:hypothetical protein